MTDYDRGRWDVLYHASCIEYGKQCYFLQDNGLVYSRDSCEYMTLDSAINEFTNRLRE